MHLYHLLRYHLLRPGGVAASLLLATVAAPAQTLPPAPNALRAEVFVTTTGNDAHPGSADRPVRTLEQALQRVETGGTIRLAAGIYYEDRLLLPRGGTPGQPLCIEGAGSDQTFVRGSRPVQGWEAVEDGRWRARWEVNSQQVFADGRPLRQIGAATPWNRKVLWAETVCLEPVGSGLSDVAPGDFYYDADGRWLYVSLPDGGRPDRVLMEASVASGLLGNNGQSYVTVRHVAFEHSNGTAEGGRAKLVSVGPSHWTLEDCSIARGDFIGLGMQGTHHTVRRCQISENGNLGIDLTGTDKAHQWKFNPQAPLQEIVIEDCRIADNNYRGFLSSWHAGGLKAVPSARGVTVRRCQVADNQGPGLWFDHTLGSILIEDNVVSGNQTGIFYEISGPAPTDPYAALISRNLVRNNRRQGIYISAARGARVENNTLYNNWVNLVMHGMPRGKMELRDNRASDNLIGAGRLADVIVFTGERADNNQLDGNFYAVDDDHPRFKVGLVTGKGYNASISNLEKLRAAGQEATGRTGDPGWQPDRDPACRLPARSPAAGKGRQVER